MKAAQKQQQSAGGATPAFNRSSPAPSGAGGHAAEDLCNTTGEGRQTHDLTAKLGWGQGIGLVRKVGAEVKSLKVSKSARASERASERERERGDESEVERGR